MSKSQNLIGKVIGFKDEAGYKDYLISSLVKENNKLKNKFSKQTTSSRKKVESKLSKLSKDRRYSLLGAMAVTAAAAGGAGQHLAGLAIDSKSRKIRNLNYRLDLAKNQLKVLLSTQNKYPTPHHKESISKLKYSIRKLNDQIRDLKTEGDVHKDKTYSLIVGGALAAKALASTVGAAGAAGAIGAIGGEAIDRVKASMSRMKDRKRYRSVIAKSNRILKRANSTPQERNQALVSLRLAQASLNTKY